MALTLAPHTPQSMWTGTRPAPEETPLDWSCPDRLAIEDQAEILFAFREKALQKGALGGRVRWDPECTWWTTDGYGNPLTSLTARQAADVLRGVRPHLSTKNAAVLAYLRAINPHVRVLLWWH